MYNFEVSHPRCVVLIHNFRLVKCQGFTEVRKYFSNVKNVYTAYSFKKISCIKFEIYVSQTVPYVTMNSTKYFAVNINKLPEI